MPIKHDFISPITDENDPDLVGPDEWNDAHVIDSGGSGDINISGTTPVSAGSSSLDLAAGDTVRMELFGYVRNTTGGTRTLTLGVRVDSTQLLEISGSTTIANNSDTPVHLIAYFGIRSTSSAYVMGHGTMNGASTANASITPIVRSAWNSSSSDWTGSHTVHVTGRGSAAGSGLNLRLAGFSILKMG